jgi:hypothetical protein
MMYRDGCTVRRLALPLGSQQVFVVDNENRCKYAGRVDRGHIGTYKHALQELKHDHAAHLV